jgi:3-methyl-2-oxobutanoate hydroxymethyltransferase
MADDPGNALRPTRREAGARKRVRVPDLIEMKRRGEKIAMLTAYDASMARLFDRAGIDVLLVGDSLGSVIMGCETTLPVTLDVMVHHTLAVSRGARRALIIADMPFLTYQVTVPDAVRNAGRLVQEGGAAAVKLEGGRPMLEVVQRLAEIGIPVMGHLGLTPQSVHKLGGYRQQARAEDEARQLVEDARALELAGAFSIVLESIPAEVAAAVTAAVAIPTIGIGAGPHCDGQVLVSYDAFGLFDGPVPPFVKQYARLGELLVSAAAAYAGDVREGRYPEQERRSPALSGTAVK